MKRCAVLALAVLVSTGCTASEEPADIAVGGSSDVTLLEGAPATDQPVARATVSLERAPAELALIGGVVAIGTDDGVFATSLGADEVQPVSVHPDQDGPKTTGAVRWLARRSADGLLVLAENGLFAASSGYLLSSPFAESIDPATISAITSFGSDAEEELWVVTETDAYWVADGALTKFSLEGVSAPITLAIGTDRGQAVVAAGQRAYFVDVARRGAVQLGADLGAIVAGDAAEDGTVHLATSAGVLSRARSGAATLRTLAPAGQGGTPVLSIAASFGSVVALTESGVVILEDEQATLVGDASPSAGSLAIDANGDAWAVEDGALYRYETGKPVSFATDVAAFFTAHCNECHAPGASSAPDHDFADFETATEWSDSIVRRLQATDATTMPPPNTEVLTASDYAVVLRWVKGGLLP